MNSPIIQRQSQKNIRTVTYILSGANVSLRGWVCSRNLLEINLPFKVLTIDHVNLDPGPGELGWSVAGNGASVVSAVGRRRAPDPQPGEDVLRLHLGPDAERQFTLVLI